MRQPVPDLGKLAVPTGVDLLYRDLVVGFIPQIHCSGETWYGRLELQLCDPDHPDASQVFSYICWLRELNRRLDHMPPLSLPDLTEIKRYSDLFMAGQWSLRTPEGATYQVLDSAPYFYGDNEVSWQVFDAMRTGGRGRPTRR